MKTSETQRDGAMLQQKTQHVVLDDERVDYAHSSDGGACGGVDSPNIGLSSGRHFSRSAGRIDSTPETDLRKSASYLRSCSPLRSTFSTPLSSRQAARRVLERKSAQCCGAEQCAKSEALVQIENKPNETD